MSVRIIHGNALDLPLEDNSVDLVVTSPPYFGLRTYQDGGKAYEGQIGAEATPSEFLDALIAATREMARVTHPTGSIWVNLGDKYDDNKSLMGLPWRYAIRCIDDLGLTLRAEVIWAKTNPMPESVTDRVRRTHEHWFHFTLGRDYFCTIDNIREHYTGDRKLSRRVKRTGVGASGNLQSTSKFLAENPAGTIPGSVWQIATEPLNVPESLGVDHFAAFPMEFPRRIITAYSPELGECRGCYGAEADNETCGDCMDHVTPGVVLDPFGGTGTTALVADILGRDGISVDLSRDYCRLAEWRTSDPRQRARAAQVPYVEPMMPGHPDLFGGAA